MKLHIVMKNGNVYTLPLNERTEITFKPERIYFTQYWEMGYQPYNIPETYYMEDIEKFEWIN